jgi:hypothetical protein
MRLAVETLCENARDKVYGVQSLLDKRSRIKANYSLTVGQVLWDAIIAYETVSMQDDPEESSFLWFCCDLIEAMGFEVDSDALRKGLSAYVSQRSMQSGKQAETALLKVLEAHIKHPDDWQLRKCGPSVPFADDSFFRYRFGQFGDESFLMYRNNSTFR